MSELTYGPEFSTSPEYVDEVESRITSWNSELKGLLPALPENISITLEQFTGAHYDTYIAGGWNYGVGGHTPTPNSIVLQVDVASDIPKDRLLASIKSTYFHEMYHIARGYSFALTGLSLMDVAIEEGLATKFEIQHANGNPWHGHYHDRDTMLAILNEVREADKLPIDDWSKWKHYDPQTERYWTLYRLGTFIADELLGNIPDMTLGKAANLSRSEIMQLVSEIS